jgi:hypothetical protein
MGAACRRGRPQHPSRQEYVCSTKLYCSSGRAGTFVSPRDRCLCVLLGWQTNVNVNAGKLVRKFMSREGKGHWSFHQRHDERRAEASEGGPD